MSLTAPLNATLTLLASILEEKQTNKQKNTEEYATSPYIATDIDKDEESKKKELC